MAKAALRRESRIAPVKALDGQAVLMQLKQAPINRRGLEQRSRNQIRYAWLTAETRRAQRKTADSVREKSCSKCTILRICTAMDAEPEQSQSVVKLSPNRNRLERTLTRCLLCTAIGQIVRRLRMNSKRHRSADIPVQCR